MNLPDKSDTAQQRLIEDVLASIPEAVAVVRGNRAIYVNAAFTRIFGYTAEEIIGGSLREFIVPQTRRQEIARVRKAVDRVWLLHRSIRCA